MTVCIPHAVDLLHVYSAGPNQDRVLGGHAFPSAQSQHLPSPEANPSLPTSGATRHGDASSQVLYGSHHACLCVSPD